MDMHGEHRIPAPRQEVWEALNDPDVLRQCIPGCEELEKASDTTFEAKVTAKVGPVKSKFTGAVVLSDVRPPQSYTISGEGKGGAAGFAKGSADVSLEEDGAETVLRYAVHATVGGKLAQLGGRLIDATAKKMASEFFGQFMAIVGDGRAARQPAQAPEPAPPAAAAESTATTDSGHVADASVTPPEVGIPASGAPHAAPGAEPHKGLSPITWISGVVLLVLIILAFVQFA